jgi:hypothetical protein
MTPLTAAEKSAALQKVRDALLGMKLGRWRFYPGPGGDISCVEFPMLSIASNGDIKITEGGATATIGNSVAAYQAASSQAKSLLAWMAEAVE